jgi:hypothetical protein
MVSSEKMNGWFLKRKRTVIILANNIYAGSSIKLTRNKIRYIPQLLNIMVVALTSGLNNAIISQKNISIFGVGFIFLSLSYSMALNLKYTELSSITAFNLCNEGVFHYVRQTKLVEKRQAGKIIRQTYVADRRNRVF